MQHSKGDVRYCRFSLEGKVYNGIVRGAMLDIVDEDLCKGAFNGFTQLRLSYPIDRVKILQPVVPAKVWCVGRNYVGHVKEFDNKMPEEPVIFIKPASTIIADGDLVRIPTWAGRIDYEGELAVIIGKRCRRVKEADALSYVAGYTCFNDVTARDLQHKDGQWTRAKGFDTFGPMGPFVLVAREMPEGSGITTRKNGSVVQQEKFTEMMFSVARVISHISMFATMEPGDVIATGTPEGVGRVMPEDRVEIEIDGIGTLSNPFIAEI